MSNGVTRARFTLDRDGATGKDELELMGLDHPLVQEELEHWRSLPPEEVGFSVSGNVELPVLLSLWMVETSSFNGERRITVQPIAVRRDGTRVPTVERQSELLFQGQATEPEFLPDDRVQVFNRVVEPTLERELKHKSGGNGDSSYSAELIGYVEVVPRRP
jgi:hypothetical protein